MTVPTLINSRSPIPVQADRMARVEDRMVQLQAQISTGDRFTEAAEAPPEALRAAMLERLTARLDVESRAIGRATTRLSLAEGATESATLSLMRASELAIAAANGTTAPQDRAAYLAELTVLRQQLLDAGNARDDAGRTLFSGANAAQPAFVEGADGQIIWQGFGQGAGAEAAGIADQAPPAGPALFGADGDGAFHAIDTLIAALQESDADLREPAVNDAITGLARATDRMVTGRAVIGAGLARLEAEQDRIEAARLDTAQSLADTKGLDLTAAIAELAALELTLNAARASFTRIFQSTLFDRLG